MTAVKRVFIILAAVFNLAQSAVKASDAEPDSAVMALDEVVVSVRVPARVIPSGDRLVVGKSSLSVIPTILGTSDPLRFLETLPEVATRGEISPGISVRGMDYSHNYTSINGGRIINPYHMLGLFSTFNTEHFRNFTFYDSPRHGVSPNVLGAVLDSSLALTGEEAMGGSANVGLLSASATLDFPVSERGLLRISGRRSYIDKVFPGLLKFDHAALLYHFTDLNLSYIHEFGKSEKISVDAFYSSDRMRLCDEYYDSDGLFGWRNMFGNVSFMSSDMEHRLTWSFFDNGFDLRESSFKVSLPSSLRELAYHGRVSLNRWLDCGTEVVYRDIRPQYNKTRGCEEKSRKGVEASLFIDGRRRLTDELSVSAGIGGVYYSCGGLRRFFPLPRVELVYRFGRSLVVSAFLGRAVQFTHLVKESDAGLPANFWIGAGERFRPQSSWDCSVSLKGLLMEGMVNYKLDAYYRGIKGVTEFDGSILNMVGGRYDPLDDVRQGEGRSYGVSLTLAFLRGNFQGWASYNLGRSEVRIPGLAAGYIPSGYDRRHDLGVTGSYILKNRFHFNLSVSYATGTPYTEAAYGYMIGENLICRYYPHNSSRLPDYFRVDFSFGWELPRCGRLSQRLDVSFYNLTAHDNVILSHYTYSPEKGFVNLRSSFRYVVPGLSYTISF